MVNGCFKFNCAGTSTLIFIASIFFQMSKQRFSVIDSDLFFSQGMIIILFSRKVIVEVNNLITTLQIIGNKPSNLLDLIEHFPFLPLSYQDLRWHLLRRFVVPIRDERNKSSYWWAESCGICTNLFTSSFLVIGQYFSWNRYRFGWMYFS